MFGWLKRLLGAGEWQGQRPAPAPAASEIRCPACGAGEVAPIIYGAPTRDHILLCSQKQAHPGGAMGRLLTRQAPTWHCNQCGHDWRGGLFAGGAGTSLEDAVIICGVTSSAAGIRIETQWLTEQLGLDRDVAGAEDGWALQQQALLQEADRLYDRMTVRLPDGALRSVFFDVTAFFGKQP